jgi:hypothetical protein
MLPDESSASARVEILLGVFYEFLDRFDPTRLLFLDTCGRWLPGAPRTRDRISNEVWFRMWQATGQAGGRDALRDLLAPFVKGLSHEDLAGLVRATGVECEGPPGVLLAVMELIYRLVESEACRRISTAYVAEWDTRSRQKARRFSERMESVAADLAALVPEALTGAGPGTFTDRLGPAGEDLFGNICRTIAEEESVRYDLFGWTASPARGRRPDVDTGGIRADGITWAVPVAPWSDGLLRPAMELLLDPDLDVKTGIQYRVTDVLAALRDPRSAESLVAALRRWPAGFTDLRAKIIYALGGLGLAGTVPYMVEALGGPDSVEVTDGTGTHTRSRYAEKREAVWALGKLGGAAVGALGELERCGDSADRGLRLHLAWALGEIGRRQKLESGGVDAGIVIALLRLLTTGDRGIVEEAALALKGLETPDFMQTIYLQNLDAVPMSSLKPSRTGLYELSETILHLVALKRPVVMAVTGDSGTGKTYFCRAVAGGFADIKAHEVVYLMRDRSHDKTLDRILGIEWLKRHVEPVFYEDYPVPEERDDPDAFFDEFIRANASKKLIVLDGWRDEAYFHPIMNRFYERGHLDILVRFQATFSTRRLNLEEREASLDRVEMHLPLLERPVLEETVFYREGEVLIYDLDNSMGSRLTQDETLEVFDRKKVDAWGDQIRIGRFTSARMFETRERALTCGEDIPPVTRQALRGKPPSALVLRETSFRRSLNRALGEIPNLLETVTVEGISLEGIAFYNHGQLAAWGSEGEVAVLTGFTDRVFTARVHSASVVGLAVAGGRIYSVDSRGVLVVTSPAEKQTAVIGEAGPGVVCMAAHRDGKVVTGHEDGTVRVWDAVGGEVTVLAGHQSSVRALAIDRNGNIYSGESTGLLRVWNRRRTGTCLLEGPASPVQALGVHLDGRVIAGMGSPAGCLALIDVGGGRAEIPAIPGDLSVKTITPYYDGRILVGTRASGDDKVTGTLLAIDFRERSYVRLPGHRLETAACVTMGPRIVTCGRDDEAQTTIRIWGTSAYVRREHDKLRLMPDKIQRPPYYRALF